MILALLMQCQRPWREAQVIRFSTFYDLLAIDWERKIDTAHFAPLERCEYLLQGTRHAQHGAQHRSTENLEAKEETNIMHAHVIGKPIAKLACAVQTEWRASKNNELISYHPILCVRIRHAEPM